MLEAAEHGHVNVFQLLYSVEGESIGQFPWECANDPSPIVLAVQHGQQDVLEYLCRIGFDVEYNSSEPLDVAAKKGDYSAVRCLLEHGAGVSGGAQRHPPLFWAVHHRHVEVAEMLLRHGSDVNYLLDKAASIHMHEATSLLHHALICTSSRAMIELLVRHGANLSAVDVYGATPLAVAVMKHRDEGAMVLLENSPVDCSAPLYRGRLPLHVAAHYGNAALAMEFIARGADPSARDAVTAWTALHFAASPKFIHSVDVVTALVEAGVPFDEVDARGETAICVAVSKATDGLFQRFLNYAADVNASVAATGQTLLHEAAKHGAMGKLRLLLETPGLDINCQDGLGRTALFHAARNRRIHAVQELLLNGASTTIADKYGATPLFAAVRNGDDQETALLLPATPDAVTQRDGFGHTVLWWAQKNCSPRVQDAILQYAVDADTPVAVDDDPGPDILNIEYDHIACYCHVCTRCVETHDWLGPAWQCSKCHGGRFIICFDCALLRGECCPGGKEHETNAWIEHEDCSIRSPEEYVPERY
jgi:ankyrin repeat protein